MAVFIDTYRAVTHLVERGIERRQAEAIVEVFGDASQEVATKADLRLLEERLIRRIHSSTIMNIAVTTAAVAVLLQMFMR